MPEESPGLMSLARDLRELQQRHTLAAVSGAQTLPDGHTITMRWCGDELALEREDGWLLLLDPEKALQR